tara:strand:- start:25 stop:138 length:114 start_codon:yes stop_codon:yes gene_type:complete
MLPILKNEKRGKKKRGKKARRKRLCRKISAELGITTF